MLKMKDGETAKFSCYNSEYNVTRESNKFTITFVDIVLVEFDIGDYSDYFYEAMRESRD